MKNLVMTALMAMAALAVACSAERVEQAATQQVVTVSYDAALPATRAAGITVNRVACAVYHNDARIAELDHTETFTSGVVPFTYEPRLALNQTYTIVFFAYTEGAYDVADLENITRVEGMAAADYEAFAFTETLTVNGSSSRPAILVRPMGKLDVGTSASDLEAAKELGNELTFVDVTVNGCHTAYNAVKGEPLAEGTLRTKLPAMSGETVEISNPDNGTVRSYNVVARSYIFAGERTLYGIDVTFCTGTDGESVICTRSVANVPLGANKATNLVGEMMTGTASYSVTFQSEYGTTEDKRLE